MKETKFKYTEIGYIPNDWEVKSLGEIAKVYDGTHQTPHYVECGIPFYSVENITANDFEHTKYISEEEHKKLTAKVKIEYGDILMTRIGSIGVCRFVDWSPNASFYVSLALLKCDKSVDAQFISYYSNSKQFKKELELRSLFMAIPQKINLGPISQILLPLPPLPEQRRIAAALSDIDTLIQKLEILIQKKQNIKQGAMQSLLTGKKRLKGFEGEWCEKKLGEIFEPIPNNTLSRDCLNNSGGEYQNIHYGDVLIRLPEYTDCQKEELPFVNEGYSFKDNAILQSGDVVMADTAEDETAGKVTEIVNAYGLKVVSGLHTIPLRPKIKFASKFLGYAMNANSYHQQLLSLQCGTKVTSVSKSVVATTKLTYPPTIDEQQSIADILTSMDEEIYALEEKKAKYKQVKQGMMQQLLTGKIRLVETAVKTNVTSANVHFRRSVLAAEIAERLYEEPTFGHVKMEKILFLTERLCHIDIGSHYHRDAAGPYDNRALRSIDSQLKKQKWFEVRRTEKGNRYVPMQNRGKHKAYFDKYYSAVLPTFEKIIDTFKTQNTERCEIVATLYSAWEDLLHSNKSFTDADIVNEVLNNWHESKKRISQDRWFNAIQWMRNNGFAPKF